MPRYTLIKEVTNAVLSSSISICAESPVTLLILSVASGQTASDNPSQVVTVAASDGKSGNERSISYTNCKVVGNGSFGVVFAARMLSEKLPDGTTTEETDIAIKKVLQDKRFKVCCLAF